MSGSEPRARCYRCGRAFSLHSLTPGWTCPRCVRRARAERERLVREEAAQLRFARNYAEHR